MFILLIFPFDDIPRLRPILAWVVAVLLVILILTLPSYFIFLPVFRRIHAELSRFLKDLVQRHALARLERRTRLDNQAEEFRVNTHLKRLLIGAHGLWRKTAAAILRELKAWRKMLAKAEKSLRRVLNRLPDLQASLASLGKPWPKQLLALPSPDDLVLQTASLRVVKLEFIISSIILPCIILVNTGMLGQIIRDLGFIPTNLRFGPVPLNVVFALILTLIEAAWGFVHGATGARRSADGGSGKIRVLPIVAVLIALGLGFLEGYFYSRIAPSKEEMFAIPLINYNVPQSDFFFFWGFALVMALFVLGKTFYDSFAVVREGTALTEIRREVKQMVRLSSRWKDITTEVVGTVGDSAAQVTTIDSTLGRLVRGGESGAELAVQAATAGIERLRTDIIKLRETPPLWAGVSREELTKSEVRQLMHSAGLWLCLTLIVGMVMILSTGWWVFTPTWLGWLLAIGQTIAFVAVGMLFGGGEVIVQDAEHPKLITANPRWSMNLATVLGVLLFVAHLVGFFKLALPNGHGLVWACNFLTGALLVAAGHQLAPLLAVAGLWLQHVGHWIFIVAEFVYEMILRVFLGLAVVIEYLFLILAYPLVVAFGPPKSET